MGYAGAVAAIACYLSLASGLARAQEWWSAPTELGRIGPSSEPAAITGGLLISTYSIVARIIILGPAGGQTNQEVSFGARLPT
jgi:hypothetical protein